MPEVRLVGENLDEISAELNTAVTSGVYPTAKLLSWAEQLGMDLVEITPNATPPVVRIIEYNKFLYQKKKREKELKAAQVKQDLKEIRFGPETGEHDYEFKLRHAKEFLEEGNKVKAYVQFRGRAIVFKDRGELLLLRFIKDLEDMGAAEQLPKLDGKRMMVIIRRRNPGKNSFFFKRLWRSGKGVIPLRSIFKKHVKKGFAGYAQVFTKKHFCHVEDENPLRRQEALHGDRIGQSKTQSGQYAPPDA